MRKISTFIILIFFLQIALAGCAHLGSPTKPLTIDKIKGTWEHIHFGYIYLYIDDSGKGFIIPGLDGNESEDILEITSITFDGSSAYMNIVSINDNEEQYKAECNLFGEDFLAFFEVFEDDEEEEPLLFMRESKTNELRIRAKEFLEKKQNSK